MDIMSIVGVILSLIAIGVGMVVKGADIGALANPAALMIIFLGTTSTILIAFPGKQLKQFPKLLKVVFTNKKDLTYSDIHKMFTEWAGKARKSGLLSLEEEIKQLTNPFIKKGMKMLIDGFSTDEIAELLEAEIEATEERHAKGALVFTQAGTYAPTLGVLGAVIGLVAALGNLGDIEKLGHAIAGAFIATLFGIYSGYVLWHPFANKLKQKSKQEIEMKKLIIELILLIQAGVQASFVGNRVLATLSETEQKKLPSKKTEGK